MRYPFFKGFQWLLDVEDLGMWIQESTVTIYLLCQSTSIPFDLILLDILVKAFLTKAIWTVPPNLLMMMISLHLLIHNPPIHQIKSSGRSYSRTIFSFFMIHAHPPIHISIQTFSVNSTSVTIHWHLLKLITILPCSCDSLGSLWVGYQEQKVVKFTWL